MKKSILALSIVLASASVNVSATEFSEMESYLQVGQITLDDSDYFEAYAISFGGQTVDKNALYTSIGGQIAISNTDEQYYRGVTLSQEDMFIGVTTKIGYSFDSESVAFIPYIGADLGFDFYDYEASSGYSTAGEDGTEFYTRLFFGAEFRINDTVGIYANKGIISMFDTNTDFQEIGLRVSF